MHTDTAMANLEGRQFGFGNTVIYISAKTRNPEYPRIKVSNIPGKAAQMQDSFSLVLRPLRVELVGECKLGGPLLVKIAHWVERHRETITQYWNSEIETVEAFKASIRATEKALKG